MNDALTDFVDQLKVFPKLEVFNASSTSEALKWTELEQDTAYQVSTRTVNTQHGQSIIKADGSYCSAWACGMLTKELMQNPIMNSRLFVRPTGSKTSKIGRVYNSY